MSLIEKEIHEIVSGIKKKEFSASEVTKAYLDQAAKHNKTLNAFVTMSESAEKKAKAIDEAVARGESLGKLAGVPMGIKDMLCTKGMRTTAGSKILSNFIPPYSATIVDRLEQSGSVVLGKCNQDEFAMGSSNEISYFGACRNPWNTDYVPGGSSGGSAVVVAARMSAGSIGTDTGGSIRQPANFCGTVGVKPTYGRVSRYGIVAFASSLDQAGPFAKSVKDSALISEVICGHDVKDSTSSQKEVPAWSTNISANLKGYKVGLPKQYFSDRISADVRKVVEKSIEYVKAQGAETVEVDLPLTKHCVPIYYLLCTSEASSNLARYDGVRFGYRADFSDKPPGSIAEFYCKNRGEGFGSEVKRRIMIGTYALSSGYYDAYYQKACQVRRLLRDSFVNAFKSCDVLLSPVTTTPAFKIGERVDDPLEMYLNDIYTTSTNLAGLPGMSVPCGFSSSGLPIGVQLTASHFEEQKMFNVAQAIEDAANVKKEVPNAVR